MLPELTLDIHDAKPFESQADAERAAHRLHALLYVQLMKLDPKAQAVWIDGQATYVVYVGGSEYLKSFR